MTDIEILDHPKALAELADYQRTSLTLPDGLEYEEWEQFGETLLGMAASSSWWVADWIRYGERRYGEMYAQAVKATSLEPGTLANYVSTANRFAETSRRRELLPFSFHYEVAWLDPADADHLLDQAEAEGWSRSVLRQAKKRLEGSTDGDVDTSTVVVRLEIEVLADDADIAREHLVTQVLEAKSMLAANRVIPKRVEVKG